MSKSPRPVLNGVLITVFSATILGVFTGGAKVYNSAKDTVDDAEHLKDSVSLFMDTVCLKVGTYEQEVRNLKRLHQMDFFGLRNTLDSILLIQAEQNGKLDILIRNMN